jgi:hypothetical protein
MQDNKQIMLAVCAKIPRAFTQASTELQDDEDLVKTVLLHEKYRDRNIRHVSERLRKDEKCCSTHLQSLTGNGY